MNLILASQVPGIAFACGLNLYLTIALLGLASRFGWIPDLPAGMTGLEHGIVIGSAITLYIVEVAIDRVPFIDYVWEAAHTLIRPAAAGMFFLMAFQDQPIHVAIAAGIIAAAVAFVAHGSKTGLRLVITTRVRRPRWRAALRRALSIIEDLTAAVLVLFVMLRPGYALHAMGVLAVILLLGGPRLWRASALGSRAVFARPFGFFEGRGWRTFDQLPRSIRNAVPASNNELAPIRAAAAAVSGLPGVGAFRNGWLVLTDTGPRFFFRSLFGTRSVNVPRAAEVEVRRGLVTDALDVLGTGRRGRPRWFTIFLLKDGPAPQVAAAELQDPSVSPTGPVAPN